MRASPRPAVWPQLVAISLMGLAVAGCSADSGRFGDWFRFNELINVAQRRDRHRLTNRLGKPHREQAAAALGRRR